jgi:hypothetical protein
MEQGPEDRDLQRLVVPHDLENDRLLLEVLEVEIGLQGAHVESAPAVHGADGIAEPDSGLFGGGTFGQARDLREEPVGALEEHDADIGPAGIAPDLAVASRPK